MLSPRILGLSATLRNARSASGARDLMAEIAGITDTDALHSYLEQQANIHLDQFIQAGRARGAPFDELYRELKKLGGTRGLSNSEVALVAALWGARQKGADVAYVSLADHFPADGSERDLGELKARLREADGILLASPVYFGDRSSLSQRFIEMIRADKELRAEMAGRLYGGIAVGAKRNGGQETTLIYQMMDMVELGLLAVGNDSDTTSQYGGTGHAGDIGTMPKDKYGIGTSIGTGRRIAQVAQLKATARGTALADSVRMGVWVLQDRDATVNRLLAPFMEEISGEAAKLELNLLEHDVRPCIACDICPTHVGPDEEYRCIIRSARDGMKDFHGDLLLPDILVPAMFSPKDRTGLESIYQQFMERTRYLRRGDYVFTDHLVVPLVFAEVGMNEHLDVRMVTSFIRHHTVMQKPIVGWVHEGRLLNPEDVRQGLMNAVAYGRTLVEGRLGSVLCGLQATNYNPVGYVLSTAKDKEEETICARKQAVDARRARLLAASLARLEPAEDAGPEDGCR